MADGSASQAADANNEKKGFDYEKLKDRNYKGEDYLPGKDQVQGAMPNRKCTDVLCTLIFIAFFAFIGWCV